MLNRLSYTERLGLKRMIDARLREQHAAKKPGSPHIEPGLLHGSSVPWPPTMFRQSREIKLPSLDYYDQASDNR